MAMLAEPKRKQKWTLNPRGKQWSDDSNKFGQKMLEKMGWTSGKGLGAKEQGMTDHIRAKYKDDQAGIGYSNNHQDKLWTEQQDSFNDLLQQLQETKDSPKTEVPVDKNKITSGQSLELKSKRSRARVHYQKFTRGKDVNKYSTKDLANIFGKKNLDECIKPEVKPSKPEPESNISIGSTDTTGGILTIMGGTMGDYFKQKMPAKFVQKKNYELDGTSETESNDERYVGFGFSQSETKSPKKSVELNNSSTINPMLDLNNSEKKLRKRKVEFISESSALNNENAVDNDETPKKRKVLKNFAFENSALDLSSPEQSDDDKKNHTEHSVSSKNKQVVNSTFQNDDDDDENCKHKAEFIGVLKDTHKIGLENNALDLTDEVTGKKSVTFNDVVEYNTDLVHSSKKKHKKQKSKKHKLDKFEVDLDESDKKKLKNICITPEKNSFINEALDVEIINEELIDNEANERKSKKSKKKKVRPVLNLDTIKEEEDSLQADNNSSVIILNDDTNDEIQEIHECVEESKSKVSKKKKKKAKKEAKVQIEINQDEKIGNENENKINNINSPSQFKTKKIKKEKTKSEPECQIIDEVSNIIEVDKKINNHLEKSNDNEMENIELEKCKSKKSKKIFKSLFIQSPVVHFIGSNINELKGYGVK
ncbi:hypothetical protein PV326_005571 [Microctonus aethiopoides]|nr:hypothetical protein PV326_005571 [Microctonus aethiopoides]